MNTFTASTTGTRDDITAAPSRAARIAGLIVSGLVVLFLLWDSIIHIANVSQVQEAMADLGFDPSLNRVFGVVLLVCLIAYVLPPTAILGAVLLTGYLGGAVATNLLTEQPIVSTTLFPIYTGILVWGGLWLRDTGVRRIMPVRPSR
ncbi:MULTISPECIES: DoxX family protein [Rhodococcus]|uniref:DoxX family protein n=1 Tax=Rhodococcus TaxID=1827 RepID=UPI000573BF70|nr:MULTISPECIES: DoxX family protein [unclassified Rhodococcus (in: high G+C Gram-positive bacteria)]KHJ74698.1 membrane protein [Rhodococcus sp. Chr-9]QXU53933.1 DoxX family protein [Rhodococcus sp. LW-XY12]